MGEALLVMQWSPKPPSLTLTESSTLSTHAKLIAEYAIIVKIIGDELRVLYISPCQRGKINDVFRRKERNLKIVFRRIISTIC